MFFDKYLAQDQFIWVFKNDLYFTRISKKIQKKAKHLYISFSCNTCMCHFGKPSFKAEGYGWSGGVLDRSGGEGTWNM